MSINSLFVSPSQLLEDIPQLVLDAGECHNLHRPGKKMNKKTIRGGGGRATKANVVDNLVRINDYDLRKATYITASASAANGGTITVGSVAYRTLERVALLLLMLSSSSK